LILASIFLLLALIRGLLAVVCTFRFVAHGSKEEREYLTVSFFRGRKTELVITSVIFGCLRRWAILVKGAGRRRGFSLCHFDYIFLLEVKGR